jgi:hypothetical protein
MDDHNCMAWTMTFHPVRPLTEEELSAMVSGKGVHAEVMPGTYRTVANRDNDYMMDRAAQKAGRYYSGIKGIAVQDSSLQESMGAIADRTKENLVSTDNGIIMARHRLMRATKALADKGVLPPGRDREHQLVRSAAVILPPEQAFKDAAKEDLRVRPGVRQSSV